MKIKGSSIPLLTFITGFCAIILQSVIIREFLVVSFGNELSVALVLAGWLAGISMGAFYSSRYISSKAESVLLWILTLMPFLSFPLIALIRTSRSLLGIQAGESFPFTMLFLISFSLIPLSSLITGLSFPLLCKVKEEKCAGNKNPIQSVYVFESAGSLLGGAVYTFYLIDRFSSFEILTFLTQLFLIAGFLSIEKRNKSSRAFASTVFVLFVIICFSFGLAGEIDDYLIYARWQTLAPDTALIKSVDTKYQNIALGKRDNQYNIYLNGEYSGTLKNDYGFSMTANFILTQHPNPENVLLIGGGITGMAEKILKYPAIKLDYVDIDPQLTKLTGEYSRMDIGSSPARKRFKKYASDGKYYLSNTEKKYDIIILNLPEPHNAVINRFYTEDFFRLCDSHLGAKGLLALSITLQSNYIGEESLFYGASIYNSLKNVFQNVIATPGERIFLLAGKDKSAPTADVSTLEKRYLSRNINDDFFSPFQFRIMLPADRVKFINDKLSSIENVPSNTYLNPVSYFYNLILWDRFSTEKSRGTFASMAFYLSKLQRFWFFIFVLLPFTLIVFALRLRREKIVIKGLQAIFVTGASGMTASLIMLFSFQNIYGYLYSTVAFIVALFMGGLTAGGMLSSLYGNAVEKIERGIILNQFLSAALLFMTPVILNALADNMSLNYRISFFILILVFGILTGMQFPLAGKVLGHSGLAIEKSSGYVDIFDHLGAFAGALLTGIILLPILGITLTCFIAGFGNILSAVLWFIRKN